MCGLCGVNGTNYNGNGKAFRELLIANEGRGKEATGVMWKHTDGDELLTKKYPLAAREFLSEILEIPNWTKTETLI